MSEPRLLGAARIRELAAELGLRPTKTLGQNFVHDANTVRRIVRVAGVTGDDVVLEVGPGLGSLTLALLGVVPHVVAVEIDPILAERLPRTAAEQSARAVAEPGGLLPRVAEPSVGTVADSREGVSDETLTVVTADALRVTTLPGPAPTALVANLPYNVSVPVLLHLLATFPTIRTATVMVQLEVAQRLAAPPGSRVYGVPSAKAAWFGEVSGAGLVPRAVFWPEPNVDSGLVRIVRTSPPRSDVSREEVFAVVDAAFAQRRKMLRSALAGWAGSASRAAEILQEAGVDPSERGEALTIAQFARIALARRGG